MNNFDKFPRTTNSTNSGTALSAWSRQQKIALISGFVILGVLIVLSACSKQSPKTALVAPTSTETQTPTAAPTQVRPTTPATATPVAKKKALKKVHAAIVTYSDPGTGVSFQYPRKYALTSGDTVQPEIDGLGPVPMNFAQPGGSAVAMVAVPSTTYPGTDFTTAFFHVNVNRSLSEQECSEFANVDAGNPDGESMDAEKVKVGSTEMEKTSNFAGNAMKQAETQYYHRYENGACYEFVLGLGTSGYGTDEKIAAVSRDEVFTKLEKILATVKVQPVSRATEEVAKVPATTTTNEESTK